MFHYKELCPFKYLYVLVEPYDIYMNSREFLGTKN